MKLLYLQLQPVLSRMWQYMELLKKIWVTKKKNIANLPRLKSQLRVGMHAFKLVIVVKCAY